MNPSTYDTPSQVRPCVFAQVGQIWLVQYAGKQAMFCQAIGFQYISYLLQEPGTPMHVSQLRERAHGNCVATGPDQVRPSADELHEEFIRPDLILPRGQRRNLEAALEKLQGDREAAAASGDCSRLATLDEEIQAVGEHLQQNGAGSHARAFVNQTERDRKSVGIAIARCIKAMRLSHPQLAVHLGRSILTGYLCTYAPEHEIRWNAGSATPLVAVPQGL